MLAQRCLMRNQGYSTHAQPRRVGVQACVSSIQAAMGIAGNMLPCFGTSSGALTAQPAFLWHTFPCGGDHRFVLPWILVVGSHHRASGSNRERTLVSVSCPYLLL
jgi:hypothetical protein